MCPNLFGHICRVKDNRLVKEVMFGTMEGESRRGTEEDRAEKGWMTSTSGLERKFTYSTERRRVNARGERWCGRHWTPTGAEPTEQWMGWISYVVNIGPKCFSQWRVIIA